MNDSDWWTIYVELNDSSNAKIVELCNLCSYLHLWRMHDWLCTLDENTHTILIQLTYIELYIGNIFGEKKIAHITATYNIIEH